MPFAYNFADSRSVVEAAERLLSHRPWREFPYIQLRDRRPFVKRPALLTQLDGHPGDVTDIGLFRDASVAVPVCNKQYRSCAVTFCSSSWVENINSRLRDEFFLRRQIGPDYLELLQFYCNQHRYQRSVVAARVGKSPAE